MALQVNMVTQVEEVDESKKLPFSLAFKEGIGHHQRTIPVTKLAKKKALIGQCTVELMEFKNVSIVCENESNHPVVVRFQQVFDERSHDVQSFHFHFGVSEKSIFNNVEDDSHYPWRCGYYEFEVEWDLNKWSGMIHVIPKNFNEAQLYYMHDAINKHIHGLTTEFLTFRKGVSRTLLEDTTIVIPFVDWFCRYEKKYFMSLQYIERSSEMTLESTFQVEMVPHDFHWRSVRYEMMKKNDLLTDKFYNRRMLPNHHSKENRFVKFFLVDLYEWLNEQLAYIKERFPEANQSEIVKRVKEIRKKCLTVLERPFWQQLNPLKQPPSDMMRKRGYMVIYDMYRTFLRKTFATEQKTRLPVFKPTPVLYEYFTFFSLIQIMRDLGFESANVTLTDQLHKYFESRQLQDGTKIELKSNNKWVDLIFNERLEGFAEAAFEKKTYFYSHDGRRKPDIRLDFYEEKENKKHYRSSMIVEVKYRPIHNIYRRYELTDAMEQMDKYWLIKRINENQSYTYQPIKKVICIYPGAPEFPEFYFSEVGALLQFYPKVSQNNRAYVVGQERLKQEMISWMKGD